MLVRRQLLRLSLVSAAAALLQACAPAAPSAPTSVPATAVPAAKPTTAAAAATSAPAAAPPAATTAPASKPTAAPQPAASGGTLTPLWGATLAHVNPYQAVTNQQYQYFATVFSQLMLPSPDKTKMDPELATVTAAPDASSYTFKLDPKAKFHDGHPLTSADVEFSYTLAVNQATKSNRLSRLSIIKGASDYSTGKAEKVSGIVPLDDQTIRFDMDFPNALFLAEATVLLSHSAPIDRTLRSTRAWDVLVTPQAAAFTEDAIADRRAMVVGYLADMLSAPAQVRA